MKLTSLFQMSINEWRMFDQTRAWLFSAFVLALVVISVCLRIIAISADAVPFNADEAIVALMGRHILAGNGVPVFFYGQAYMGSLDAILVALGFGIFGEEVWVVRLVQILLFIGFLLTSIWLAYRLSKSFRIAAITGLLLAFPTVNVFLYTTVSLGGYGEALLIGNLILIVSYFIGRGSLEKSHPFLWLALSFLTGFGFWVFGLTLVFSIAAVIYLVVRLFRSLKDTSLNKMFIRIGVYLCGLLIGLIPILSYVLDAGSLTVIQEVSGSAIAGATQGTYIEQFGMHLFSFLLLGVSVIIGIRPPWEVRWLLLPVVPVILFFWTAAVVFFTSGKFRLRDTLEDRGQLILLVLVVNLAGFLLTPFGSDPSGRYFLPMALPLAIIGAVFINYLAFRWKHWLWIFPTILCGFYMLGIVQSAARQPPGITTQFDQIAQVDHRYMPELINFLTDNDLEAGYTNYWVAYPLAFLSRETLIYVPSLPYHLDFRYTTRDNRYAPYNENVKNANRIAYITTHHEPLNEYLREKFRSLKVDWSETLIGDYRVFYDLTEDIRPGEIGLGVNQ